ncbi:NadC Nicotinate-nucleotide pyrophosphorylase [Fimbriimonadaceae bacterium]
MSAWHQPEPQQWWHIVEDALSEDVGSGDITGAALSATDMVRWHIEAQADGIICGLGIAEFLLAPSPDDSGRANIEVLKNDGDAVSRGTILIRGLLSARQVMMAERTALNFLMHLSGVATLTHEFVERVKDTDARIVDTRKTIPMLRSLQKYAVRCGGGHNHRMGLYDGVMLKDNHIAALGGIKPAVKAVRGYASHMLKIEVECETLEQVAEAVEAGADIVMLDNMDPFMMREAVKAYKHQVLLEASGGVSLETVRGVALTGVHLISVGALTHSAVSLPMHLELL